MTGIINEEWRSISEYINYQVSNIGRVRNANTGRILKMRIDGKYCRVCLSKNNEPKPFSVHRLVATEFIENLDNKPLVDHINRDTSNNCVDNLRWVSVSQNAMNKRSHKGSSSKYKGVYLNKRDNNWRAHIYYKEKQNISVIMITKKRPLPDTTKKPLSCSANMLC